MARRCGWINCDALTPQTVARSRIAVTALVTALLGIVLPIGGAQAHNGVGAFFKGSAGGYIIYAYDGYPLPHNGIEYRLILLNQRTGDPATDVAVHVTANRPDAPATAARTNLYNNVVLYDLPNPYPGDWSVTVSLRGKAGAGTVRFRTHGYQPPDPTQQNPIVNDQGAGVAWLPTALGVGLAVCVLAGVTLVLARRRHGDR